MSAEQAVRVAIALNFDFPIENMTPFLLEAQSITAKMLLAYYPLNWQPETKTFCTERKLISKEVKRKLQGK